MRSIGWVVLFFGIGIGALPVSVHAQMEEVPGLPWLTLSGETGMRADGYTASNISGRRPALSSEVFANVSVEAFGATTGIDLLYSTESNDLRQSMNRLGFNTSWEWGEVSAGTVSPNYSRFSLRGATLRGGAPFAYRPERGISGWRGGNHSVA